MRIVRLIRQIGALAVLVVAADAQAPKRLQFEVASVKPSPPDREGSDFRTTAGNDLRITNASLSSILVFAFDIREYQLSGGPGWMATQRYDIVGKPPQPPGGGDPVDLKTLQRSEENTREQRQREMLRSLLADRFGLIVHRESRENTVYSLEVAKGGAKIKAIPPPWTRDWCNVNPGWIECYAGDMDSLAKYLSGMLQTPVNNHTKLTENYDFDLRWARDTNLDTPAPSLFTALQEQLGLRLVTTKGAVETIVVDQVNRASEN
jgi:uncharacterized protein (TIGR03435 family)